MTSLHWGHFAIYLRSGCPEQNPGLPQWFCREVGWQEAQLQCLASWECPCFQQCCPQCSEVLQQASASRLIHQTLLMGGKWHNIRQTTQITVSQMSYPALPCPDSAEEGGRAIQSAVHHMHNAGLRCKTHGSIQRNATGTCCVSFIGCIFVRIAPFSSLRATSFQVFTKKWAKKETCMCCIFRIEVKTWELPFKIQWLDQIKPSLLKGGEGRWSCKQ